MSFVDGWLLIGEAMFLLFLIWRLMDIVANCIEYWQAARRGEDAQALRERGD